MDPLPRTTRGYYAGTRVNDSWWRRYREWGCLTRGNGEIWLEPDGLRFRLLLTETARHLPLQAMTSVAVEEGRWHRRIYTGTPALRIEWRDGADRLVSWFCVSRALDETRLWASTLDGLRSGRRGVP